MKNPVISVLYPIPNRVVGRMKAPVTVDPVPIPAVRVGEEAHPIPVPSP